MSTTDQPLNRGAIIAELAGVTRRLSDLQVQTAKLTEGVASTQGEVGRLIQLLATPSAHPPWNRPEKFTPAALPAGEQAAPPPGKAFSAQDEARPVQVGKALDEAPVGDVGRVRAGQSRKCPHEAGAGGASAASADTAPAADAQKQLPLAAEEPRVLRREPQVRAAGGGLVQDGGSRSRQPQRTAQAAEKRNAVLDHYARTGCPVRELAKVTGVPQGTVANYMSDARREKDLRVQQGDRTRDAAIVASARPATITTVDPTALPAAAEPQKQPAIPGERPAPPPMRPQPGSMRIPDGLLIAVKAIDGEVHGPGGVWRTQPNVAKAFGLLSDGILYGLDQVAKRGEMDVKRIPEMVPFWATELRKIGLRLIYTPGIGLKLNPLEAGA